MNKILPGSRVLVFDTLSYKDDVSTPLSTTMKPATVLCRYGYKSRMLGKYSDLVDVRFDDGRISNGHFTSGVKLLYKNQELPTVVDDSIVDHSSHDLLSDKPECDCEHDDYYLDDSYPHRQWCSSFRIAKICT